MKPKVKSRVKLRHLKIVLERVKFFTCGECQKIFWSEDDLCNHIMSHHLKNSYSEDRLQLVLSDSDVETNEISSDIKVDVDWESPDHVVDNLHWIPDDELESNSLVEEDKFTCFKCDKQFLNQTLLFRHQTRVHNMSGTATNGSWDQVDIFSCDLCNDNFESQKDLSDHKDFVHGAAEHSDNYIAEMHCCSLCNNVYKSRRSLTIHLRSAHKNAKNNYSESNRSTSWSCCTICEAHFSTGDQLAEHVHLHKKLETECHKCKPKPPELKCPLCVDIFAEKKDLNKHILSDHTSLETFECKKSEIKKVLNNIAIDEKKIKEQIAQQIFSSEEEFIEHLSANCSCRVCQGNFRQTFTLSNYLNIVHIKPEPSTVEAIEELVTEPDLPHLKREEQTDQNSANVLGDEPCPNFENGHENYNVEKQLQVQDEVVPVDPEIQTRQENNARENQLLQTIDEKQVESAKPVELEVKTEETSLPDRPKFSSLEEAGLNEKLEVHRVNGKYVKGKLKLEFILIEDKTHPCEICRNKHTQIQEYQREIKELEAKIIAIGEEKCTEECKSRIELFQPKKLSSKKVASKSTGLSGGSFRCNLCSKTFKAKKYLKRHIRGVHKSNWESDSARSDFDFDDLPIANDFSDDDDFYYKPPKIKSKNTKCNICDRDFETAKELQTHKESEHPEKSAVLCQHCGQEFKTNKALGIHIANFHGKKPRRCHICKEEFQSRKEYQRHKYKFHPLPKTIMCEQCPLSFDQPFKLRKHINTVHKKLRPEVCQYCGKHFSKGSLSTHIKNVHFQRKAASCDICHKKFQTAFFVKRHKDHVHNNVRAIKCTLCDKTFPQTQNLLKHMNGFHFKLKPFTCELCGNNFAQTSSLYLHKKNVHHIRMKKKNQLVVGNSGGAQPLKAESDYSESDMN